MSGKFGIALVVLCVLFHPGGSGAQSSPDWSMNATIIEACSCPMFCQCYFNSKPAAGPGHSGHGSHSGHEGHDDHGEEALQHFCRFNNAFRVNSGHYGSTKLDGVKFWVGGDLGDDFSDGEMGWAVLHFDKAMTKEQRDGVAAILGHVYPVQWTSFATAEGTIEWKNDGTVAHATLDGGKSAEVRLTKFAGMTSDPVVIHNLKYWGVPRNDGFVLMPNDVQAYRLGDKSFEFKGTNGFMITFDISSKDTAAPGKG